MPTLWDLFQHWYNTYAVIHKGAHGHKQDLARFNQQCKPLHNCRLDKLTKYQITEWHQQLGKSRGHAAASTFFDALGRTVKTVANYVTGTPGVNADEDVTVEMTYQPSGQIASLTAKNAATGDQITRYIYG
ncbi:MAG: hypothetical protein FWE67_15785, partial [Planctomycetaceae bacterium]|nr:hypothetical protein [Planctomycetaceae bacterium]